MKIVTKSVFEDSEDFEKARIPGIICTRKGTLIAYCELRQTGSDWAVIDIGMKRSTDGGNSWSERKILFSGQGKNTVNNPVMISDGDTVHFLCCLNYKRVFYMKSTDEGETWSSPVEITESIREQTKNFFWSCIATGPTHGIKLLSGTLLVPVWLACNKEDEKSHHPSVIALLYSRDKGQNWELGEISHILCDPSEFSVAQGKDGRIFANIRHEGNEKYRAIADITKDFSIENIRFSENLPDPVCCAGFIAGENEFFFVNCASQSHREFLTLKRLSEDFSVTEELLLSTEAGYSDIALSVDKKTVFILFEKGKILKFLSVEV